MHGWWRQRGGRHVPWRLRWRAQKANSRSDASICRALVSIATWVSAITHEASRGGEAWCRRRWCLRCAFAICCALFLPRARTSGANAGFYETIAGCAAALSAPGGRISSIWTAPCRIKWPSAAANPAANGGKRRRRGGWQQAASW